MKAGPSNVAMDVDPPVAPSRQTMPPPPLRANISQVEATVGFVYSTEMTEHFNAAETHHECPERIVRVFKKLSETACISRMKQLPIREVHKEEALLVHTEDHWYKVRAFQHLTSQEIVDTAAYYDNLSLYVNEGTTRAALFSCGGVIEACTAVARSHSDIRRSIALVRPPGHHAEPDNHMGFCFFNNVAVAARVVQQTTPVKRILILDWDVHHGNGTHRTFNDDPSILYISLHRYEDGDYYPCGPFGSKDSCGEGPGVGFSVNIPWPSPGMTDGDYIYAFQKIVMPIATEFAPEMVIISAGFDAADKDELGECHISPAGYAHMTHMLCGLAGGRVAVALEGGYNLDALEDSALAVTRVLLGDAPPELQSLQASYNAIETVWDVANVQSRHWRNIDIRACQPLFKPPAQSTTSISEILKAHRQHYLYTTYNLMVLPIQREDLVSRFPFQLLCTPDMLSNDTLVIFAHQFGNLRAELTSSVTCDLNAERSCLREVSRNVISWIQKEGYALIDVNLFAKPSLFPVRKLNSKSKNTSVGDEVLTYLWDNYIAVSKARRIILIGHDSSCESIIKCVDQRWLTASKRVKAVVQVIGRSHLPWTPTISNDFKEWYANPNHSLLVLPVDHPVILVTAKDRHIRAHGSMMNLGVTQPVRLLKEALPGIQSFVKRRLKGNAPDFMSRT